MNLSGVQIVDAALEAACFFDECSDTLVTGCTILDGRSPAALMQAAVSAGRGQERET